MANKHMKRCSTPLSKLSESELLLVVVGVGNSALQVREGALPLVVPLTPPKAASI